MGHTCQLTQPIHDKSCFCLKKIDKAKGKAPGRGEKSSRHIVPKDLTFYLIVIRIVWNDDEMLK